MGVKDRYHERGADCFFRVRVHTTGKDDEISPWVPLKDVGITDALACSRAELGPVYCRIFDHPSNIGELYAVSNNRIITSVLIVSLHDCQIATPDELKAAGLWE